MTPVRARVAYEHPETAARLRDVAPAIGLSIESETNLAMDSLDAENCQVLLLEQRGNPAAFVPRMYSVTGANPDLLVLALVPAPRSEVETGLLAAGAFDVIDDGPDMERQFMRAFAGARRVVALQEDRARLSSDLTHHDKLAAIGLLAAGVSHEVNNPCSAILSNIVALREQLEAVLSRPRFQRLESLEHDAPDWLEAMGDCIAAAKRIHAIVKSLNVFSRRTDLSDPQLVDINEEIATVLRLIGKEVRFQARFEVLLDPDLPRVMAPPNSITQIVTNLVVNALQALEIHAKGERSIWISTSFDDDSVLVEVADNGPGIAQDILGRIFDPFFTTKRVGDGTGLGLAITRSLVHKAGGEIFAESAPGEGARFRMVFTRPAAAAVKTGRPLSMPPATDRLRVLILDDDELMLRSVQRSLSNQFECIVARGGLEALESLRLDDSVDVVLSDVVMPGMNGLEFFRILAERHPHLAGRTIFFSGGVTSDTLRLGVVETGRPCLNKPIDLQELVKAIRLLGATSLASLARQLRP